MTTEQIPNYSVAYFGTPGRNDPCSWRWAVFARADGVGWADTETAAVERAEEMLQGRIPVRQETAGCVAPLSAERESVKRRPSTRDGEVSGPAGDS